MSPWEGVKSVALSLPEPPSKWSAPSPPVSLSLPLAPHSRLLPPTPLGVSSPF
jgi:hypothetical protein